MNSQNWRYSFIVSGLVEYLLDRNEEGDMSCKTAKYNIVKTIFESSSSRSIFSPEVMTKFQVHVRQGVIYVQTKTEIALEGASWGAYIFKYVCNIKVCFS